MDNFSPVAHLDVTRLAEEVLERYELFDLITLRQDAPGSNHKPTKSIFLRGPESRSPEQWFDDVAHDYYMPEWRQAGFLLHKIWRNCGRRPLGKAMIVALAPGGAITPHIDGGDYATKYARFHLPLQTSPSAVMLSGDEAFRPPVGMLTWFNNHVMHSAVNLGEIERIHLIVDVRKDP